MKEMSSAIERLRFAFRTLPGVLAGFSEPESEQRPSAERWTKKEALGHLIDSASNNHQRFVRGQLAGFLLKNRGEPEVMGPYSIGARTKEGWVQEERS
jgi:hypothetical protein